MSLKRKSGCEPSSTTINIADIGLGGILQDSIRSDRVLIFHMFLESINVLIIYGM